MNKLTITFMVTLCLFLISCNKKDPAPIANEVVAENSDMSVYLAEGDWQNQFGKQVKLSTLQGKIQVVAMVYTSCQYACPRIVADMKKIEQSLSEMELTKVGFVLASIDPARDDPKKLQEFSLANEFDAARWTLLTGNQEDVRELAALLGVQYKPTSETDFSHSNIISILSQNGVLLHQQQGLGIDPKGTLSVIREYLK